MALPTAQSSFTKSNDGTVTAHHDAFGRQKKFDQFNISLNYIYIYIYINTPSQYDIVSMAKRFHIGFYKKCKKCVAYVDSRKKHFEPPHDKTNKMTFVPSDDSDQPGHPPSLIRVFAVRSMGSLGPNFASGGQRWLWSDWADAQADLSLCWAHTSFCWFCHAVAQFSNWNHFRNHCVWHCN